MTLVLSHWFTTHVAALQAPPLLDVYSQVEVSIPLPPVSVAVPPRIVPVPLIYEPEIVNPDKVVAPTIGSVVSITT